MIPRVCVVIQGMHAHRNWGRYALGVRSDKSTDVRTRTIVVTHGVAPTQSIAGLPQCVLAPPQHLPPIIAASEMGA